MLRKHFIVGLLGLVFLLTGLARPARAGEVIDRIVATVNGHPILQSDWDEAVAYEEFADARSPRSSTLEQRKSALDRLIDQELIREQMERTDLPHASAADIDRQIEQIRKLHSEAGGLESWQAAIQAYGLTESELRDKVAAGLDEMRAVDAHLRPSIQVDSRSVEAYYRDKLLPELRQSGSREVPLDEVAPKIRELLAQQRMNDALANWIRTLRSESKISNPWSPAARAGGSVE